MVRLSPVGLAAAPVANQLSVLATFREKLCHPFCIDSSVQPLATLVYSTGTPVLNGTTVFVPVTARITIVTGSGCNAKTQLFTEQFYVAFQGQTAVPTSVTITSVGRVQGGANVQCGCAYAYSINDSLTVTITPPTA
jgi:hypothetical protein